MAKYRCFSIDFYNNDNFLDLENSEKVLYTYLNLYADDYGIVVNPLTVMRICGASKEDKENLIEKGYLYDFGNGKTLIIHWQINNQIQPSKLTYATNEAECKQIGVVEDTKEYVLLSAFSEEEREKCGVFPLQYKIRQDKIIKDNIIKDNTKEEKIIKNNVMQKEDKGTSADSETEKAKSHFFSKYL
jgi:hypothetical protein